MSNHRKLKKPRFTQPIQPAQFARSCRTPTQRSVSPAHQVTQRRVQTRRVATRCAALTCLLALTPTLVVGQATTGRKTLGDQSAPQAISWHTGSAWQRALQRPIDLAWSQQQLRTGLRNLAKNQHVAIFLSCRVNPNQAVDFSSSGQSLEETLRSLAKANGLGIGFVGPVIYVGRPAVAARLATAVEITRQKLKQLPSPKRALFRQRNTANWKHLGQPRELILRLNASLAVKVINVQRIPHDLWPAYDLPPLDYCEQMTLLLAGFDSSFELDSKGTTCTITALPLHTTIKRSYPARTQTGTALASEIRRSLPATTTTRRANRLIVEGRWEDHLAIRKMLDAQPGKAPSGKARNGTRKQTSEGQKRFQLNVKEQPVGPLLDKLASKLHLDIDYATASQPRLETRVSVALENMTREQLFDAIAEKAGLKSTIKAGTVWIEAR